MNFHNKIKRLLDHYLSMPASINTVNIINHSLNNMMTTEFPLLGEKAILAYLKIEDNGNLTVDIGIPSKTMCKLELFYPEALI